MNDTPFCRATALKFRIDIQSVSLVIYARFLYHYGITTLSLAI